MPKLIGPYGLRVLTPSPKQDKVVATRVVVMPDGTQLVARRRTDGRRDCWTAEVPMDIAMEVFANE